MDVVTLRHGCKINFFLKIGERLPDGYHTLESLFLPVEEPSDVIEIRRIPERQGTLRTAFFKAEPPQVPVAGIDGAHNTLTRAHAWYAEETGFAPALDIRVFKGIPAGGGLGGGSANAAALLRYLQDEAGKSGYEPLEQEALVSGAKKLGADVPFFLLGRPALATGIGEKLCIRDNPVSGMHLLLLCPDLAVSTAWAYAELDAWRLRRTAKDSSPASMEGESCAGQANAAHSNSHAGNTCKASPLSNSTNSIFKADQDLTSEKHRANYSPPAAWAGYGNDFEEPVFFRYPELASLKEQLLDSGADIARMSGTGSSMFAVFQDKRVADKAAQRLANNGVKVYSLRM